ncbi:MAG: Rv2407 family type 3 sulfatase [Novosphingobium sp.]
MKRQLGTIAAVMLAGMFAASTAGAATPEACPVLRWTTLGTAGGPVPTSDRSEPANLLTAGEQSILVDTGDGTVDQLARAGLTLAPVHSVFISHHHLDHTGGLAAVIGLRWMNQFPGTLTVYGPPGTRELVDGIVASMAPQSRIGFGLGSAPDAPARSVTVVELTSGTKLQLGALEVAAVANSHFAHPGPQEPVPPQSLSYRFTLGKRSITYTGDTGPSAAVVALAKGSDMLVSEVIELDMLLAEIRRRRTDAKPEMFDQMRQHLSTHHLTAIEVGRTAAEAGVGHLVMTHLAIPGPLSGAEPALRSGVDKSYHGPVDIARDLSSFSVPCR